MRQKTCMLLAVMLCDGSSSSEISPVTSLSLSSSICKTELKALCYPTKTLVGQVDTIVGVSQLRWGIEALTSIKYTNINLPWGDVCVREGKEGTKRPQPESENDSGPCKLLWRGQSWLHLTSAAANLGLTLLDLSHLSPYMQRWEKNHETSILNSWQ